MPPPTPPPLRHTLAGRGSLLRRPPFAQLQHHPRLLTPILLPRRLFSTPTTDPTPPSTPPSTSFQKTLKAQRKERSTIKSNPGKATDGPILWDGIPGHPGAWEIVCGLEIHAQLNTPRKLFSDAKTSVNESPNTHVALFDAALPGSQPVFQAETLLPALRAAVALNCEVMRESRFDRKHYFYWDQPGGYQITQFYHPLAKDGYIKLFPSDGIDLGPGVEEMVIGIKQVQMEQDTAKTITTPSLHPSTPPTHLIDLNRVSHPLIEVITTPCLPSPLHASLALRKLQSLLRASHAAVLGMEWGGLRCDVNVSVRPRGSPHLGQRTEIKNLSSIKLVEEAVAAEARRQVSVLTSGGEVLGETRGWDAERGETFRLRGKEGEVDYRFMPEPDVAPVVVGRELLEWVRRGMPELPDQMLGRLTRGVGEGGEYGLTLKDANTLMGWDGGARVGWYEEVVGIVRRQLRAEGAEQHLVDDAGRVVGNWVVHDLPSHFTTNNLPWSASPITPQHLADITTHLLLGKISGTTSKSLIPYILSSSSSSPTTIDIPTYLTTANLLLVPLSEGELRGLIEKCVNAPEARGMREQYEKIREQLGKEMEGEAGGKEGKKAKALEKKLGGLRNWFVGRVVREGGGRVDARRVEGAVGGVLDGGGEE